MQTLLKMTSLTWGQRKWYDMSSTWGVLENFGVPWHKPTLIWQSELWELWFRLQPHVFASQDFQHLLPSKRKVEIDWMSNMTFMLPRQRPLHNFIFLLQPNNNSLLTEMYFWAELKFIFCLICTIWIYFILFREWSLIFFHEKKWDIFFVKIVFFNSDYDGRYVKEIIFLHNKMYSLFAKFCIYVLMCIFLGRGLQLSILKRGPWLKKG